MYLFRNFLDDADEYAKSEELWLRTLNAVTERLGQKKRWKAPWIKPKFADGTPHQDGNPMFNALDQSRRLAINIIQVPAAAAGEPDLIYWTKTLAEGDPEEAETLVISCVLSDDTLAQASELMTKWAKNGTLENSVRPAKAHRKARPRTPRRRASRA